MLDPLAFYIPEDRRQAIAVGDNLARRMKGAALYVDVSGFTPLTEALVNLYGPQRGAEELTSHLEHVYDTLIDQLHRYQGSVIGYSGDAITCWFHEDDGHRAIATALGMQAAMKQLAAIPLQSGKTVSLAVKVAVVVGEGQRMLVGDPNIQLIDLLGFPVVEQLAAAAKVAYSGEIVVDEETGTRLQDELIFGEKRNVPDSSRGVFIIEGLKSSVARAPWPELAPDSLQEDQLRPWVLPAVYERMRQGYGQFMTELRPAVALFLQFAGIDFDHDPQAEQRLDSYVRWVQAVMARHEGILLQVILGEKGNYLYGVFGAPVLHEDDARRAVLAALELRTPPPFLSFLQPVPIGISRGIMRTGPSGSTSRHVYSVMGDDVNVAARLMEAAKPGEIIVSARVMQRVIGQFEALALKPLVVKGKSQPISVYQITGTLRQHQKVNILSGQFVGRSRERAQLNETVTNLVHGQSRVAIVEGEAGIGKSSLIANWLEDVSDRNVDILNGSGDVVEQSTPYHAWAPVFHHFFQWDSLPPERELQQAHILARLEALGLAARAPLLNAVLPLDLPENDLTRDMTDKVRADHTHELLTMILQQAASEHPMMIVIEDAQWMDSASWALAAAVVRHVNPILLVLVIRPLRGPVPPEYLSLLEMPTLLHLQLDVLQMDDAIEIACQRLGVSWLPEEVTTLILQKAEGHPFFSEELAYALRDSGVLQIADGHASIAPGVDFASLNLPETVEGIVTSRIDLLSPGQQLTLKVASVIGRVFAFNVLEEVHPVPGDRPKLQDYLDHMQSLDVTALDTPAPDLSYRFKHIITQEAAYNLLLFAQRRQLHQAVAEWYERVFADDLSPFYPLLAHHWLSANETAPSDLTTSKSIEYLEKSGVTALHSYANREAVDYFEKLLVIVPPEQAQSYGITNARLARWEHQLGEAHNRLGHLVACEQHFIRSLAHLGFPLPSTTGRVIIAFARQIARQVSIRLRRSPNGGRKPLNAEELESRRLACTIYERLGLLNFEKNNPELAAFYCVLASLNLAEEIGPSPELAIAYSYMASAFGLLPVHRLARLYERLSLATAEQVDNSLITARVLMAVSVYSASTGRLAETADRLQRGIAAFEQNGVWEWWGVCMEMLARIKQYQGQYHSVIEIADRLYAVSRQQGDLVKQSWGLTTRMDADVMLSNFHNILESGTEIARLVAKSRETGPQQKFHSASAWIHLQRGEWAAAEEHARQVLSIIAGERPTSFGLLNSYVTAAHVYLHLWEHHALPDLGHIQEQATAACNLLQRYANILPIGEPASLRARGLYAWLIGEPKRARSLWRKALLRAKTMGMPLDEALTNYELGRHLPAEDPKRQKYLAGARELIQEIGARYYEPYVTNLE